MILKRLLTCSYFTANHCSHHPPHILRFTNVFWEGKSSRIIHSRITQPAFMMTMSSRSSSTSVPYPRAAVAVTVQSVSTSSTVESSYHYLLVQRAKQPDQGKWSLPGGKIELGETTLVAAQRELTEETCLQSHDCKWSRHPFMTTDAIFRTDDGDSNNKDKTIAFHYVIAQCFAQIQGMPAVIPSDDALDAKWWTLEEIRECSKDHISEGVPSVIERAEELSRKDALLFA